jgi:outer membrane receptor protein involved in Fe transport
LATIGKFEGTSNAPFSERDEPQKCERDHYFDVGLSRRIITPWQITVDSYCKLAQNLLDDGQFGKAVILNNFNYTSGTIYGAELSSTYKQGPLSAYGNVSYVQTWAHNVDSAQFEFPTDELAYIASHHIQLDHQGRLTSSAGLSYVLLKNTRLYTDFLYGNGLRAGFANLEKLPSYWTQNVGVEHVFPVHSGGIREVKLRVDCLNVFDEVYELRNGTGLGIAAPAYGPRRAFYGGLSVDF